MLLTIKKPTLLEVHFSASFDKYFLGEEQDKEMELLTDYNTGGLISFNAIDQEMEDLERKTKELNYDPAISQQTLIAGSLFYIQKLNNDIKTREMTDKEINRRIDMLSAGESEKLNKNITNDYLKKQGYQDWIWGASGSQNPREEHQLLYGKVSPFGKTPASGGEYPAELPNCDCEQLIDLG